MSSAIHLSRTVCQALVEWVHSHVDGYLPVTYTEPEARRRIRRLDPAGARHDPSSNKQTDRRIWRLVSALGVDDQTVAAYLNEARGVRLEPPKPATGERDLPSPMCSEDKYTTYAVTRAAAPRVVIETGVAHGASSAYILAALQRVPCAVLISIEKDRDPRVGQLVPNEWRDRWTLCRGDSLALLPRIAADYGGVDLFLHDSLHTYRHMRAEFEAIWPAIRPGGLLCAHDILHNNVFPRFVRRHQSEIDLCATNINFGMIRKKASL